jgi:hypothetical protein
MKSIDISYQESVNRETEKLFGLTVEELLKIEDYGSVKTTIDGKKKSIDFWHWKLSDNLHHMVFIAQRRAFLFFRKKYINGIKIDHGKIQKLSDEEIGSYD